MKNINYDLIEMALSTFQYLSEYVKNMPLESISRINVCIEDELDFIDVKETENRRMKNETT